MEEDQKTTSQKPEESHNPNHTTPDTQTPQLLCREMKTIKALNLSQSTPPLHVLDRLQSKYAKKSISQSQNQRKEWSNVSVRNNTGHEMQEETTGASPDKPDSQAMDTTELIARLAKRNLEAQQFLQKNKIT